MDAFNELVDTFFNGRRAQQPDMGPNHTKLPSANEPKLVHARIPLSKDNGVLVTCLKRMTREEWGLFCQHLQLLAKSIVEPPTQAEIDAEAARRAAVAASKQSMAELAKKPVPATHPQPKLVAEPYHPEAAGAAPTDDAN